MPQIISKYSGAICQRCGQRINKGDLLYPESRKKNGKRVTQWDHVYCPTELSEYTKAMLSAIARGELYE